MRELRSDLNSSLQFQHLNSAAVSEQEAEGPEGTCGPYMQYTETTDLYRKADHQYFEETKFRFKTWSSKCHLHSQVLVHSDLQIACEKLIWVQVLWNRERSDTYQNWRFPKCMTCMHVPLQVGCIHQKHSDSNSPAQQPAGRYMHSAEGTSAGMCLPPAFSQQLRQKIPGTWMKSKGKCRTQNVHWTHQTLCSYLGKSPIFCVHLYVPLLLSDLYNSI